jgi:hypothetical protein
MAETWLVCSACRSDIAFGAKYYQCSVSTCNRARMRLVFCSVSCWDSHVATLRHRDAWAEDKIAPTKAAWERELAAEDASRAPAPAPRPAPAVNSRPASGSPASASTVSSTASSGTTTHAAQHASSGVTARTAPHVSSGASAHASQPTTSGATARATSTASPTSGAPRRVVGEPPPPSGVHLNDIVDNDILIVMSKLKKYIKERSGMNCSDAVAEVLSEHVRAIADESIRAAGRDERKTVLDRDVPRPRR